MNKEKGFNLLEEQKKLSLNEQEEIYDTTPASVEITNEDNQNKELGSANQIEENLLAEEGVASQERRDGVRRRKQIKNHSSIKDENYKVPKAKSSNSNTAETIFSRTQESVTKLNTDMKKNEQKKVLESVPDIKNEEDIEKMNSDELAVEIGNIESYINRAADNDKQEQFGEYLGSLENEYKKREIADAKKERKEEFEENETEQLAREIGNISDRLKDCNVRPEYIESTRKEIEDYENKINGRVAFLTGALKDIYSRKSENENESKDNYSLVQMKDQYIKLQEDIKNIKEQIDKIYKSEQSENSVVIGEESEEVKADEKNVEKEKLEKIEKKVGVIVNNLSKEEIENILNIFNSEDEGLKVAVIKALKKDFSGSGLDLDDEGVIKNIINLAIQSGEKRLEDIGTEEQDAELVEGENENETEIATNSKEVIQTVKETAREGQIRILGERIKVLDVEGGNFEKVQIRLEIAKEKLKKFQEEEGMKEIIAKAHGSNVLSEDEAMKYKEYAKLNKAVSQETLGYVVAYSWLLSSVDPRDIYEVAAEARSKSAREIYVNLQDIEKLIENQKRIFRECDPKTRQSVSQFKDAVLNNLGQEMDGVSDLNKIKNIGEFSAMIPEIDKQLKSRDGKLWGNKKSSSKEIRKNLKYFVESIESDSDVVAVATCIEGYRKRIKDKESDYAKYANAVLTVMEELLDGNGKREVIKVVSSDSSDRGEQQEGPEQDTFDFEVINNIGNKAKKKVEKKMVNEISEFINNNSSALEERDLESLIENEAVANKILNELLVLKDSAFKMYVSGIIKEKIAKTVSEIKKLKEEKGAELEGKDVFSANKINVINKDSEVTAEGEDETTENNVTTSDNETDEVQLNNEIINEEVQDKIREELTRLKESNVENFHDIRNLAESFRDDDRLFGNQFTEEWFENRFFGNESIDYEELKDIKVKTVMAVLKKLYEEVEAEQGSGETEGAIDLNVDEIEEDTKGKIKEAGEVANKIKEAIELKNKATMNKYLQDVDKKVLQELLDSSIASRTEIFAGGNQELQSEDIEEIIEKTEITMKDEDKQAMELLTFDTLKEIIEEILKTKTSESGSQGAEDKEAHTQFNLI